MLTVRRISWIALVILWPCILCFQPFYRVFTFYFIPLLYSILRAHYNTYVTFFFFFFFFDTDRNIARIARARPPRSTRIFLSVFSTFTYLSRLALCSRQPGRRHLLPGKSAILNLPATLLPFSVHLALPLFPARSFRPRPPNR